LDRVLRIGIIQEGRIVRDERLRPGRPLTVGRARRAQVRCDMPGSRKLLARRAGRYHLRLLPTLEGKLARREGVRSLKALRAAGEAWLPLRDSDRGSIRLGERTLLFQLVEQPPVLQGQAAQVDLRPLLVEQDEPVYIGFLGLFSVLVAIFSIYSASATLPVMELNEEVMERFAHLQLESPQPKAAEIPLQPEPAPQLPATLRPSEPEPEPVAQIEPEPEPVKQVKPLTAAEAEAAELARKEELERQVGEQSALVKMIISRGESRGGTVSALSVFDSEDEVAADVDGAMEKSGGQALVAADEIQLKRGVDLDYQDVEVELGTARGGDTELQGGGGAVVPSGRMHPEESRIEGGDRQAVQAVIASYRPGVKACYETRLKQNDALAGRLVLRWNISAGQAHDIVVLSNSTGDVALGRCVSERLRSWSFPEGLEMAVSFPFVFSAQ